MPVPHTTHVHTHTHAKGQHIPLPVQSKQIVEVYYAVD